jgi:hypothetical protein
MEEAAFRTVMVMFATVQTASPAIVVNLTVGHSFEIHS